MNPDIEKVIPIEAIPEGGGYTKDIDGKSYLIMNEAMFTFFRRSMGEFSPFFLALRDEKKILGCKCTSCGIVRIPPFLTRCPDCNFASTELVEVDDIGKIIRPLLLPTSPTPFFISRFPPGAGGLSWVAPIQL